jgi:hypothetical protein
MASIETPPPAPDVVKSLGDFLRVSGDWHKKHAGENRGMLSDLWYRGVNERFDLQSPGVYRESFTKRASALNIGGGTEEKRLHLERNMVSQFRSAGAAFLDGYNKTQIYFAAQHYGMPTRLLDWSTNPLAALFFVCDGKPSEDGYVYAMDAGKIIPPAAEKTKGERLYQSVMTMRHPFVEYAIGVSFWDELLKKNNPFILPVRPDAVPGRIGQQSSCFTLHMHGAANAKSPTMITIKVDAKGKGPI